ncbi:MAG: winged helix DNA-binding protein [Saprospiraceae bacterium]|nr:winged helix DNA-binding protein [Saprospiraceae bacterium]
MSYQPIKALIDHFEAFESSTGQTDLGQFASWLNNTLNGPQAEEAVEQKAEQVDQGILQSFGELSHHARHYVKKLVRDTPLSSWNDLVVVIVLYHMGSQRKSDVIQQSLMDLSPGIEVLKRLIKRGIIIEEPDPADKRAKRVELSKEGRALYESLQSEIQIAGQIVAGNLTTKEKWLILPLLQKLVHFHQPIFVDDTGASLQDIFRKYIKSRPGT